MNIRKAASLLLTFTSPRRPDYFKIMLLKRGPKSKFMPNLDVFPGGVLDPSDCDHSWRELYNFDKDSFSTLSSEKSNLRVYSSLPSNGVPGEVALRICAIREAFEESGVLLARPVDQYSRVIGCKPGTVKPFVKLLNDSDSALWRQRVHTDSSNFIAMCRHFECVPDIHSLAEWANWLTPLNYKIRFDTMFYICSCDTEPESKPDFKEISVIRHAVLSDVVANPHSTSFNPHSTSFKLAPPQMYELHRLHGLTSASKTPDFGYQQNSIRQNYAVRILSKDGFIVSMLEDDDLYPTEYGAGVFAHTAVHHPQSKKLQDIELRVVKNVQYEYVCDTHTAAELRDLSDRHNRIEIPTSGEYFPQLYKTP